MPALPQQVYDMLMATLSRLEPELLLAFLILSDTLPANFDSGTAAQVRHDARTCTATAVCLFEHAELPVNELL
jgi:hypothetical protein